MGRNALSGNPQRLKYNVPLRSLVGGSLFHWYPRSMCGGQNPNNPESLQGALAQKSRYIRIQNECRELALNAGRPNCNISCMAYFSNPTIAEFECSQGRIRGDSRKAPLFTKSSLWRRSHLKQTQFAAAPVSKITALSAAA